MKVLDQPKIDRPCEKLVRYGTARLSDLELLMAIIGSGNKQGQMSVKYGYPPDQQALATDMVLEQARRYGNEWSQKRAVYETGGGASLLD